jgi:glycerophosphoryl diester phosphodiesterase
MHTLTLLCGIFLLLPSNWIPEAEPEAPFLYVAHRGASYLAPENTLASIQLAWELGADAAECDVMLSADNRVLLFHDKNTKKLSGVSLQVKEATWDQLNSLVVIPRESNLPGYSGETIPLLEEVLATIPEDRMLVIEIKTGPEILPHLQDVIDQHWKNGNLSFIAFDFETIRQTKELYPEIPCYYLSMFRADLNKHFDAILEVGLDGVDLRHTIIDEKVMKRCQASGLEVWCWTVNDPKTAQKMKQLGVSAVTTDRPAWLRKSLENTK